MSTNKPKENLPFDANARREEAVNLLLEGVSPSEVARRVKYSDTAVYNLIQQCNLGIEVQRRLAHRLIMEGAPAALDYLIRLVKDEKASERVRADAAKTLLDRAGMAAKAAEGKELDDRALADMSKEELRAMMERAQRELAERATPVIDATVSAPDDSQASDILS